MGILALLGVRISSKSQVDITLSYQFWGKYSTIEPSSKPRFKPTNICKLDTRESIRDQEQWEKDGLFSKW